MIDHHLHDHKTAMTSCHENNVKQNYIERNCYELLNVKKNTIFSKVHGI
jgi:hypothetical protein